MNYKINNFQIKFDTKFVKVLEKLDNSYKIQVKKQIKKISQNPLIGKPMRNTRKGTREVYLKPFRISYEVKEYEANILRTKFSIFLAVTFFSESEISV